MNPRPLRILGIGECNDLAAMYLSLAQRGHAVRVFVADPEFHGVFAGLLPRTPDWRSELDWVRAAGSDGVVLFESAVWGEVQDALRADGFNVVGGSALGDRLEADRSFGQQVLQQAGLQVARCAHFTDCAAGADFIERQQRRWVLKFNGANSPRTRNYIGQAADGRDVAALLRAEHRRAAQLPLTFQPPQKAQQGQQQEPVDFVLMEFVQGVEVGVGGYFNGQEFLGPVCVDFEHKRFFPGDLGELTGEMGTIVSYRGSRPLFRAVLAPLVPLLREGGYCGYINVNLMANADGLWPLEFTSRFGYPGFAICAALHTDPWDTVLRRLLRQGPGSNFGTRAGFAAGVVLTVPPFPYRQGCAELSRGLPIFVQPALDGNARDALAFAEVESINGQLVTSGATGYLGVATGTGRSVAAANRAALAVARRVLVPNLRYRTDIGARLVGGELAQLRAWGWLGP